MHIKEVLVIEDEEEHHSELPTAPSFEGYKASSALNGDLLPRKYIW